MLLVVVDELLDIQVLGKNACLATLERLSFLSFQHEVGATSFQEIP